MLNRDKMVQALTMLSSRMFIDDSSDLARVRALWQCIAHDTTLAERLRVIDAPYTISHWHDVLGTTYNIVPNNKYSVLAVDGSQIYPDRHMPGGSCFLINVGGVHFVYDSPSKVRLFSEPHVFLPDDVIGDDTHFTLDIVDLLREAYEFKQGASYAQLHNVNIDLVLFDGSLIFWHLESLTPQLRDRFLGQYLMYLTQFYEQKLLIAGYLSLPRNRDISHIVQAAVCERVVDNVIPVHAKDDHCPCQLVEKVLDSTILSFFLKQGQRTIIFKCMASITQRYPTFLTPYFFYINVGEEIARIEIPAWIAQNEDAINRLCAIILDQSTKGNGYPVSLAESHEQAVVKGADRDFFYHVLCKIGITYNKQPIMSQKNLKKRSLGI